MMITFAKKGKTVDLAVKCYIPWMGNRIFSLEWNCASEEYAALLTKQFQSKFSEAIKNARNEAYDQGWKDAKSKRAVKEIWFSGDL